ncbi:MAG: type II secretion system F family protein [Legionella sp.]|nr:type II secretion system F family protein [Legionella sp.]
MDKNSVIPYQWEGVNGRGEKVRGIVESNSVILAKTTLRKQGIIIRKIVKKRTPIFDKNNKKINSADITAFSRQLATMFEAGIPLVQAFDIAARGQKNKRVRDLIGTIKNDVERGLTFAEALEKHPAFFNDLFCNLVDAGEKSGSLDIMLSKIATYKEKIETLKKKIKKALTYPMAVVIVAFVVTAALLIFVVPQFESLFKGFGADLPALTRAVVDLSIFFQYYWYIIFALTGLVIYTFKYIYKNSTHVAHLVSRALLKCPIVGAILRKAAIARFSRTLSITVAAGLPLVDALKSVSGATGNIVYAEATNMIKAEVSTGLQMHVAMENSQVFPTMAVQMVAIGEESGALEQMLSKIADFYEEEVDNAVDSVSSLMEPLIMSLLGILIGGLVVAMYLPIFKLGSVI